MELLIAILVTLGIVTSDDAKSGKFSSEDIKIMAERGGVTEEKVADYEKEQAEKQNKEKEEGIFEDDDQF